MRKIYLIVSIFAIGIGSAYAQNAQTHIRPIDNSIKTLAVELNKKLVEAKAEVVALRSFTYEETTPVFGTYLLNQLTDELVNIPRRPYIILSDGSAGADWIISGEIVEIVDIVRVYTRIIKHGNRSIVAAVQTNLERNEHIVEMLGSGSSVRRDAHEPDSWDNPVTYEIGADENAEVMNRTIHNKNDEDFFLLIPEKDGRLAMETKGNIDTYMELYDHTTREKLAEDDDGGLGNNARIRYNVQAGKRYIAKVRGYGDDATGHYGFLSYFTAPRPERSTQENPITYGIGAGGDASIFNSTLEESGDQDFFLLVPDKNGQLTMETVGNIDTFMELYDLETGERLADDDDSGENYNARIRHTVQAGKRYIVKVRGFESGDNGEYGFKAYF